jgi:RNA polymerase sigma factor (sigma-70 family)
LGAGAHIINERHMSNDTELLRRYVEEHSESAFTELVHEHLNLVYSAALRETNGDSAQAEDVSQAVFTELARKASRLVGHPSLPGWLYTTVRHLAANVRRAEQRRRCREEEVQSMNELLSEDSPDQSWQQIRPVLDDALHELNEADRAAVVLRFLESRSLREVGARLGLNENAARMRVDRALERLRSLLTRRGITSTASSLAAAMAVGVITPAPAALAATIAGPALASGVVAGSTTLTLMNLMSITKVSLIGALVVAGVALPVWQQTRLQRARSENETLRAQETEFRAQATELASLRSAAERLRKAEADQAELEHLRQWQAQTQPELLRLRGMVGVAGSANLQAEQLRAQLARPASDAGTNPVSGAMADVMKHAMEQQMEGRLSRMTASLHLTPEQVQAARDILMQQSQMMSAGMQQVFSGKYDKEELARLGKDGGNAEEQIKALLTPDQKTAYASYQKEEAASNARLMANNELLQMQSSLGLTSEQQDRAFAALYEVSFNQLTDVSNPTSANQADAMQWALDQKAKALESVLTPTQLESYRRQQAIQAKLVKDILSKMQGPSDPK